MCRNHFYSAGYPVQTGDKVQRQPITVLLTRNVFFAGYPVHAHTDAAGQEGRLRRLDPRGPGLHLSSLQLTQVGNNSSSDYPYVKKITLNEQMQIIHKKKNLI